MKKITAIFILLAIQTVLYAQWSTVSQPTNNNLYSLYFTSANTGIIGGVFGGPVFRTTDGGLTFNSTVTGTTSWYLDIFFINSMTGFASGQYGALVKTTNGGLNWSQVLPSSTYLHSVRFPSSNIGYAVGSTGIYKSTNGGDSWSSLSNPFSDYLLGVHFINDNTGFICGEGGRLAKTTNGGISWNQVISLSGDLYEEVMFTDNMTGYVAGRYGRILKSTDGGNTWNVQVSGTSEWLFDIYMINNNTGWASGFNGTILKTTNGGQNWSSQITGIVNSVRQIHFVDANTGYAVTDGGKILKTTNGGGGNFVPGCFTKLDNDPTVTDMAWGEGCAWGDYDNDGDQDLIVTNYNDFCWSCTHSLLLYRNDNGSFTRITTGPIATKYTRAFGAAWGDYDNDGKLDLFVCTGVNGPLNNLLFHNEGNGNFIEITTGAIVTDGGTSAACSWIDYNKDGWLDMFVVNGFAENDFLYKNNCNGTFTKITTGAIVNDGGWGRSSAVGDYDNDGWSDIFVVSYQGQSDRLYRNNNGDGFTLVTNALPVDNDWGSGAAFGDYDNDGNLDLYVTNHNSNNRLYRNNGNGTFLLSSALPSTQTGPYSFGCTWGDYDNDGKLDLFVTNWNGGNNFLYHNQGSGNFTRVSGETIATDVTYGIGSCAADINLDGKLDYFVANNGPSGSPKNDLLYVNTCQQTGNFIGIKLRGCTSNKSAIGTRVTVKSGGISQIREVSGGQGYHGQDMLWQHFGLGSSNIVDSIIVKWPGGLIQRLATTAANQYITIDECSVGLISNTNEIPNEFSLSQNYPNPFNPSTKIKFAIPGNSNVMLKLFDSQGKEVTTLVNSNLHAGYYEYEFNASNLSSGIYFYKIITDSYTDTKKMVLIK